MTLNYQNILSDIYKKLYLRDIDKSLNIFLCGASTTIKDSIRTQIQKKLNLDIRYNIALPETLFSSKLYKTKSFNLLELENKLASDVDAIIIPNEGFGTICELGAFAINKNIVKKIIVVLEEKLSKNNKIFINIGPIDLIKKENKKNVITYKENKEIPSLIETRLKDWRKVNHTLELDNIFNLSRFVLYSIALFQPITLHYLKRILQSYRDKKIKSTFIEATIQNLNYRELIESYNDTRGKEYIRLSPYGHNYVFEKLIPRLKLNKSFTQIRLNILYSQSEKSNFKMEKELEFLEF